MKFVLAEGQNPFGNSNVGKKQNTYKKKTSTKNNNKKHDKVGISRNNNERVHLICPIIIIL